MGEYNLQDFMMVSAEVLSAVHELYRQELWVVAIVFALATIVGTAISMGGSERWRQSLLWLTGLAWLWLAVVYHPRYHAQFNWAAHYWAAACCLQGLSLLVAIARGYLSWLPATSWRQRLLIISFSVTCVLPSAGWLGWPGEAWLSFGFGPGQTVFGSLLLMLACRPLTWALPLAILPALMTATHLVMLVLVR